LPGLLEQIEKLKENPQIARYKAFFSVTVEALKLISGKEFQGYEEWEKWWLQVHEKFEVKD
jgi:hypothetical protein